MTDERTDDELLESLGQYARERQERDALRPMSGDFKRRMAQQISAAVSDDATDASREPKPQARRTRSMPWLAVAASVLAAVGLTVSLVSHDPVLPLPGYSLEFRGGAQVRSGDAVAPLQMGDRLDIVLRPDKATDLSPGLFVFTRNEDQLRPVDVEVRWSDEGAARVSATLDASLPATPGAQTWWFVIASDDNLPSARALKRLDADTRGEGWQAFRVSFDLEP